MGYGWGGYPEYVSVAEKKAKAERKLKQLMKKNPDIKPIIIEKRTIAHSWWGKSWNTNLEKYADYRNRISRGRSYVRNGTVLDLRIAPGKVTSLVQGTRSTPYSIVIKIKNIKNDIWKKIKTECEGKLDSLQELLIGKFPKALGEIFTIKGAGLFPAPKEIEFECSCPDWAYMCKHVAATLYGIGARLDEDPALLFKLRKAEVGDLISQAVKSKTKKLLNKSKTKSERVISDSNISDIFGIEMDEEAPSGKKKTKTVLKTGRTQKSKSKTKIVKSTAQKSTKKAVKKTSVKSASQKSTNVVKKSSKKAITKKAQTTTKKLASKKKTTTRKT